MPKTLQSHFSFSKWNWKTQSVLRPWGVKLRLPRPSLTIKTLLEGWSQILSERKWHLSLQDCFWSDFRSYNWMRLGFPFTIPFTKWINRKCWTGEWHCWECPYSDSFQGNSHRRSLQEMNPWPFRVSLWSCECSGIHGRFGPAVWGGGAVGNSHPRSTLVLDNGMRKKRVDFQKIPVSWCLRTSSSSKKYSSLHWWS